QGPVSDIPRGHDGGYLAGFLAGVVVEAAGAGAALAAGGVALGLRAATIWSMARRTSASARGWPRVAGGAVSWWWAGKRVALALRRLASEAPWGVVAVLVATAGLPAAALSTAALLLPRALGVSR